MDTAADDASAFTALAPERWVAAHGVTLSAADGGLLLAEDHGHGLHLMTCDEPALAGAHVTLRIVFRPLQPERTQLYVSHSGGFDNDHGGFDIAVVGPSGSFGIARSIVVERHENGDVAATIDYLSTAPMVAIGGCRETNRYAGDGNGQFVIRAVSYRARPLQPVPAADRVVVVDVGAAGGVQLKWRPEIERIHLVMVEPLADEAARLETMMRHYPAATVLRTALSDRDGEQPLYLTAFNQATSLMPPDMAEVGRYRMAPAFDLIGTETIRCRRYDSLMREGLAPQPDAIKVDVQGAEKQVLDGLGAALDKVLGIELEAHFYPLYRGETLLGDLVTWLATKGFRLRALRPSMVYDKDLVEVDVWFTRSDGLSETERRKLDLIERVWHLQDHPGGASLIAELAAEGIVRPPS